MKIGLSNWNHIDGIMKAIEKEVAGRHTFSLLDVGCGKGVLGYCIKSKYEDKVFLIGVDSQLPSFLRVKCFYDLVYLSSIQRFLAESTEPHNIILANHVLEHLDRPVALQVIELCKQRCDVLIVGLPEGKPNHVYPTDDNPHTHKWGATTELMTSWGFVRQKDKHNSLYIWRKGQEKQASLTDTL